MFAGLTVRDRSWTVAAAHPDKASIVQNKQYKEKVAESFMHSSDETTDEPQVDLGGKITMAAQITSNLF